MLSHGLLIILFVLGLLGFARPQWQKRISPSLPFLLILLGLLVVWRVGYGAFGIDQSVVIFGFAEGLAMMVGLSALLTPILIRERPVIAFFAPFWFLLLGIVLSMALFAPSRRMVSLSSWPSEMHFVLSMLAHSAFTLWALMCSIHLLQTSRLHEPSSVGKLRELPPLLAIERQGRWLGGLTWILLSLALISGFWVSGTQSGVWFLWNHKFIFSALAWIGVTIIVIGSWKQHWRGNRINQMVLLCYGFLLLGYMGTRFVIEIVLGR